MKKFKILVGKTTCQKDTTTTLRVFIEGSIRANGSREDNIKVIEYCPNCFWPEQRTEITVEEATTLIARMESFGKPQVAQPAEPVIAQSSNFLAQIDEEAKAAIRRGWDASKVGWRKQALIILLQTALSREVFTVNDFRDKIKESGITTHDNRAMGGLMVTARGWGWIKSSGDEIRSRVGHGVPLQVWKSNIVQHPSNREQRETTQNPLL